MKLRRQKVVHGPLLNGEGKKTEGRREEVKGERNKGNSERRKWK
jgi:hypothetical protein